jgi:S-adenosylmethionine:tRNA ribosyltransferase-isomerase
MRKSPEILDKYDFDFPTSAIAKKPAHPRDSARLYVYNRVSGEVVKDTFSALPKLLPPKSIVVFNRTKVVPARLWAKKTTGGRVQIFYLGQDRRLVHALSESKLAPGLVLTVAPGVTFEVVSKEGSEYTLKPSFALSRIHTILERYGTTPIPPYIKDSPLTEKRLRREYQTVFARTRGSVAAPTASLHFTERLLEVLKKAGHDVRYITLHVGLGTFASLTPDNLSSGRLHGEGYSIDRATASALDRAKRAGRTIVAVGTTTTRALESAVDSRGRLAKLAGKTDLFIRDGYRWKYVDALITNFHVPRSSLLMLVAAFIGDRKKTLALYRQAIKSGFRLFSFGDGMLIK